ncbi:dTDP-4-dehydrorhamnose reductase [Flavobacterium phycosphaerae]|uniref:dTDP-4-dehydrorhamnose reductase n=1 Tax=Flavobacterium phycosphaerae TaxID=2697515 RepID=UPI0013895A0F|nr:dTDP-4-dehydrorhamnose reductase [Flavobacterium phycosphaerae]
MVVLVTGANGQLGQALQLVSGNYPEISFVFCASADLDITDKNNCATVFAKYQPHYCINSAAYTAVDKAESEPEKAYLINVVGAQNLAEVCQKQQTVLLHVSTDFVFDGSKTIPYTEEDSTNPMGVYGQTKLDGEHAIREIMTEYYIIRTSWVYSQFGNNFMKTMLRLASERDSLSVVNDQIGTPTHAVDLAEALIKIIQTNNQQPTTNNFGIYNFSNEGQCSWYDFAKKIFEVNHININLLPIPTSNYPTPAKRPAYSVLDKGKMKRVFGIRIDSWEDSLKNTKITN